MAIADDRADIFSKVRIYLTPNLLPEQGFHYILEENPTWKGVKEQKTYFVQASMS
jgi:hypothetical protein